MYKSRSWKRPKKTAERRQPTKMMSQLLERSPWRISRTIRYIGTVTILYTPLTLFGTLILQERTAREIVSKYITYACETKTSFNVAPFTLLQKILLCRSLPPCYTQWKICEIFSWIKQVPVFHFKYRRFWHLSSPFAWCDFWTCRSQMIRISEGHKSICAREPRKTKEGKSSKDKLAHRHFYALFIYWRRLELH